MKATSRRSAGLAGAIGVLAWSMLAGAGTASGSQAQPAVVSAIPASYTPNLESDSSVSHPLALAVAQYGDTVYVGGRFSEISNAKRTTTYIRRNIVAFSASTGAVSTFAPNLDGNVNSLLAVGDAVYVGGEFANVNGQPRPALVKLDAATGEMDPGFTPTAIPGGRVSEIRLVNNRLFVGGTFSKHLIALDPDTGADTNYVQIPIAGKLPLSTSKTEVYRFAINPQGTRLVAVGNFTSVAGQNRQRAFMLDLDASTAALSPWYYPQLDKKCLSNSPTRQAYLEDVDFSPDGSYFVFAATGYVPATTAEIGKAVCDAAARFETNTMSPKLPTWINYTGGDTLHAVSVTGAAVYVQGHNRWLDNPYGKDSKGPGAVDRLGIGAIDPVSGKALSWAPPKPAAQGGQDLLATSDGLWVVSDSTRFNYKYHHGIAFAPLP